MSTQHQLPGVAELIERFRTFRYSVFRLETLQVYAGSGEDESIAAFRRGEPYTPDAAEEEYAAMLRSHHSAGKLHQRVHVVVEPVSDYLAYELTWEYGPHEGAGEDIGIIPTNGGWPADVLTEDFWLFDSRHLFDMHYSADGTWLGAQVVTDPDRIAGACFVRDAALHQAVPWHEYLGRHPELVQRLPGGA